MVCLPEVESVYIASKNDSFNLEAEISTLLTDSSRSSFALPRELNAEQRKHAKKTVEQYPDLKCESFGFGQDRQLHVFKKEQPVYNDANAEQLSECSPSVRVKNTFIDDWVQDGMPADRRNVQSMPHNMFAQCLSAEMTGPLLAPVESNSTTTAPASSQVNQVTPTCDSNTVEHQYALGSEVVIDGLVKAPMFNGASGVIQSWDEETGRYNILLAMPTAGGQRWAKVKGENLRLVLQPRTIKFGSFDE